MYKSFFILVFIFLLHNEVFTAPRIFNMGVTDYFGCDYKYKIQQNDTCESIAKTQHIKISLLQWKNKKLNCRKLTINMTLCIDDWI